MEKMTCEKFKLEKEELYKVDSFGSVHSKSNASSAVTGLSGSGSASGSRDSDQRSDERFQWKSQWQHIMFFLSYTISWTSILDFRVVKTENERTNIVQIMLVYVFFGCPTLFIQIFIGQFTQKGCLVIGKMMPFAYGLGYFILLNTFFGCVLNLYHCVFLLYFLFVSMINYPLPPWMLCFSYYYNLTANCLGIAKINRCLPCYDAQAAKMGSCFDPNVQNLSSSLFFQYYIVQSTRDVSSEILSPPSNKYFIHLLMSLTLIGIVIVRTLKDLDGAVRIWNIFTITSLTIMITVITFTSLRLQGILFFFEMSWESFVTPKKWVRAVTVNILNLKLYEAGNILFGSFTPVTVNTATRAAYLCLSHFCVMIILNTFLFLLLENFMCRLNTTEPIFDLYDHDSHVFVVYPEALGLLAAAPLWSTLYFLFAFGVTLQTCIIQLIIIEMSLSNEIVNSSYFVYTRFLILLVASLLCLLIGTPQAYLLLPFYLSYLTIFRTAALFFFTCVVALYGFQRLCDDVYFLLRYPPTYYLRVSWFISFFLMTVVLVDLIFFSSFKERMELTTIIIVIMSMTLLLGFFVKFFQYLKAKDLMSMLRQADAWGPADAEAKTNRRLFNPRYEVRFRRRVEKCNHRCLLNSSVLKKTLEKELALVSNVLLEIEDNEENRKLKQNEMEHLRMHRTAMTKFLAERAPDEIAFLFKKHVR